VAQSSSRAEKQQILVPQIDYPLVARPRSPMYLMHMYLTRKPPTIVGEYIDHYSKKGEIVLDPFCGSGVTVAEALKHERKAIGIDLNPLATFVTRMTTTHVDLNQFQKAFDKIEESVKEKITELYDTDCPKCKRKATIICTIWKREKEEERPIEVRYYCSKCKDRNNKVPSREDIHLIEDIEKREIPYWYPRARLGYPDSSPFLSGHKANYVHELFTKRNLLALSLLYHEIDSLDEGLVKELVKFTFSSMMLLGSKMTPVRKTRPFSSHVSRPHYWLPPEFMESNVWRLFARAFKGRQGVLKGKIDSMEKIKDYKEAKAFDDLEQGANVLISNQSALDLSLIPDNSVDYVFTDPPYGGSVQHFEMSASQNAWLGFKILDEDEVTINRYQKKDFERYHTMLHLAFKEIFRCLKPEKFITVTFHNTDIKVYNSVIRAAVFAGFDLEKIIYQLSRRASVTALMQPYGSAIGDYYLRFRKPSKAKKPLKEMEEDKERYERIVIETVKKIIAERGEPTAYTDILKGIYVELDKYGYLLVAKPEHIEKIIRNHKGKEFVFIEGEGWWFKNPSEYWLHIIPLQDRVETAILQVLRRKPRITFDDVLQEIFMRFKNALTPDPPSVKSILEEYAEKTSDGKWRLRVNVQQREKEHSEIIIFLAEIGRKVGYKVWVGQKEQTNIYDGKPLSEWCDFKDLTLIDAMPDKLSFLKQIDLLWLREGKISHAFEVEYTTAITEAFNRCSNIPESHNSKKFIVIPEERERLLYKKVNSELLRERVEKEGWGFIFFKDLIQFFNENKRKRSIETQEFENITKVPLEIREKQITLDKFSSPTF